MTVKIEYTSKKSGAYSHSVKEYHFGDKRFDEIEIEPLIKKDVAEFIRKGCDLVMVSDVTYRPYCGQYSFEK